MRWCDHTVAVDLSRESIQKAPAYDATSEWGRDQELGLYRHYGRSRYLADSKALATTL